MNTFQYLNAGFWLVIIIIAAIIGLNHSFYGLMVNIQNSSLHTIELDEIEIENIQKNRYLNIIGAISKIDPLTYEDENGKPVKYIYALSSQSESNKSESFNSTSKIILESKTPIKEWRKTKITGLLKPYWHNIDQEIILNFQYSGVKISDDVEYLQMNTKPWKWYWHFLIILIAILFFYRMFEAIMKKLKGQIKK